MAKAKSIKSRRADALTLIAQQVKAHAGKNGATDGLVRVYPVGEYDKKSGELIDAASRVPGVPAIVQDVEPSDAERLLAYRPPAFTLYESGRPMKEHTDLDELDSEAAWAVSNPADADDEPDLIQEAGPSTPDGEQSKEA